jgi:hypothetical protein
MFRSDRDALAQEVEDLRQERERLQAQNDAMRADILTHRQQAPATRSPGTVYKQGIEHLTPGERVALQPHSVEAFPVWLAIVLHFLTFGLFSLVHFSNLHDRLPKAEQDDPSAGKAIGFSFIPYFNFYWIVFNTLRLADRMNLQFRLRGLPDRVPRGLALAAGVLSVVPYLNMLVGFTILWPIAIARFQRAANELAALPRDGADAEAAHAEASASPAEAHVRVPLVRDLPGPDEVSGLRVPEPSPGAEDEDDDVLETSALIQPPRRRDKR